MIFLIRLLTYWIKLHL
ncbi:UNVERIFIED_CONTAM: hypothetical protein GTU68_041717 [Idotea baltica]|nr:hypothetical protein [Idotea baltica]